MDAEKKSQLLQQLSEAFQDAMQHGMAGATDLEIRLNEVRACPCLSVSLSVCVYVSLSVSLFVSVYGNGLIVTVTLSVAMASISV